MPGGLSVRVQGSRATRTPRSGFPGDRRAPQFWAAATPPLKSSTRGRIEISWAIHLTPENGGTRVHLRFRLAGARRPRLVEYGGGFVDLLTVAGLAAGLRERAHAVNEPQLASPSMPPSNVARVRRSETPSLARMRAMWCSTVLPEMCSRSPISL